MDELSDAEVEWIEGQLAAAEGLARAFTGDSEVVPSLDRLDETVRRWRDGGDAAEPDVNTLVNALGIAFGEHLRKRHQLQWVIATDEHGTDLALHGQPGNVLIYPANTTAKRVVAGEDGFFPALFDAMGQSVESLRNQ